MNVAFVRCRDITFSNRIQKTIRWSDLQDYADLKALETISFTKLDYKKVWLTLG
jgi:hypothetical protein